MKLSTNELKELPLHDGFRLRGLNTTRLETFLDAAFAFAVTMLVISIGDIPESYDELIAALKGIPSFLACFAAILIFWTGHRRWSRRYGLEYSAALLISLGLIFVLLVYVYPLRLIFSAMFSWISGGWLPSQFKLQHASELINLFIIYGLGYAAMAGMMALLHIRAKNVCGVLGLNKLELIKTDAEIISWSVQAATGFISALFALLMPKGIDVFAGFVYLTLPVSQPIIAIRYAKKAARLNGS